MPQMPHPRKRYKHIHLSLSLKTVNQLDHLLSLQSPTIGLSYTQIVENAVDLYYKTMKNFKNEVG